MTEDIAISVNDVSKMYKLYDNPMDRLKESLGLSRKKKYKEHYALNHVSFQVHKGETVGIIGTNGSGKSTILKIITGVLSPTGGEVSVNGRISSSTSSVTLPLVTITFFIPALRTSAAVSRTYS